MRIAFSPSMLSIALVAISLGFIVGLHSTMLHPDVADRPGARSRLPGSTTIDLEPSHEQPYRSVVLLLGVIAVGWAIVVGCWTRLDGDQGIRTVANTLVGLGVMSLLLLAVETAIVLFMPLMDVMSQIP